VLQFRKVLAVGAVIAASVGFAGFGATAANASVADAAPFNCPNGSLFGGQFPNPSSSGSFYTCSNGTPYQANCPFGMAYNPFIFACNLPQSGVTDMIDKFFGTIDQF
jgi:hypothetical protein